MRNLSVLIFIFVAFSCESGKKNSEEKKTGFELYGNTQGTTFAIVCNDDIDLTNDEVKAILHQFDLALSSYIPQSVISAINAAESGEIAFKDSLNYFQRCYVKSMEVYINTEGYFDPTIAPLVKLWGFKDGKTVPPDSVDIEEMLTHISFAPAANFLLGHSEDSTGRKHFENKIFKNNPNASLNFDAIAQGLSVDVLAELLDSKGANNYLIEIGGELRAKGKNAEGNNWRIGIDEPLENSTSKNRKLKAIVNISDRSIATSGNYRSFYEFEGVKYAHTINPKTGYPVQHTLLSVTVVAPDCASADAYATAFMVMGVEKSNNFITNRPDLDIEAYFIYADSTNGNFKTLMTEGMKSLIEEVE